MTNTAILEKYGIDLKSLKTNGRGYRVWKPEHRKLIVQLAQQLSVSEVAEDLSISKSQLYKWTKESDGGPRASHKRQGAVLIEAELMDDNGDAVGFPTKPRRSRGPYAPREPISFQAADIRSAIALLTRLQGQRGKVNISIE